MPNTSVIFCFSHTSPEDTVLLLIVSLSSFFEAWINGFPFTVNKINSINEPPRDQTNNVAVRPAKTQISEGIRPVWSENSLSAWRKLGSIATHWAHSEDSDQTGRMSRLIWVFAGRTVTLLVLSRGGSNKLVLCMVFIFNHVFFGRSNSKTETGIIWWYLGFRLEEVSDWLQESLGILPQHDSIQEGGWRRL